MKRFTLPLLLALAAPAAAEDLGLHTANMTFKAKVDEKACLDASKSALQGMGFKKISVNGHAVLAMQDHETLQVECMQFRNLNGLYLVIATVNISDEQVEAQKAAFMKQLER